ncbi:MAG TPA: TldD/PmbA family protein [Methanoregulaceae archaeon]|nr:TldD/PmbA family protein [Methanoregulaceae archaeon]
MRWWVEVDHIESVLKAGSLKADEIEVYYVEGESVSTSLRKKEISEAAMCRSRGMAIRTIRNGRIGVSSTNDPENWEKCLSAALASGELATPQDWGGLPGPADLDFTPLSFDPEIRVDPSVPQRLCEGLLEGASRYPADIPSGSAEVSRHTTLIANSNGVSYSAPSSTVSVSLEAISGQSTGYEFENSYRMDIDPAAVGAKAAWFATSSVGGKDISSGVYDVILSPIALSQFLGAVFIPALSGRSVHAGRSRLASMMGEIVTDERISLYDDPFHPRGLFSTRWDAEGSPAKPLQFVKDGILENFAYDLKTAYRYKKSTTGSAVRSGSGGGPSIGVHNVILEGNERQIMDDPAIYVHDVVGAHTANPLSGDFSVELSNAYLVEDGEFSDPVRKAMMSGNVFEMLKETGGVGTERRVVGKMILPALRLENQKIIGV